MKLRYFIRALRKPKTFMLFLIAIALACVSIFLYASRPTPIDRLGLEYTEILDKEAVKSNLKAKYKKSYELKDYTIYGETLSFYNKKYSKVAKSNNSMSILAVNVETKEEIMFYCSGGVDSGIDLAELPEGLYEVYVYDNYVKKRVYFKKEVESTNFSTMRRDGQVKNITLQASKDYLSDFDLEMDKNYLFISVVENIPMVKTIDVLIDPGGNVYSSQTNTVDYGVGNDLINEADASYKLAKKIKKELESHGLKVELTRDKDGTPSYYGKTDRAGLGYESQAKLFLSLGMYVDESITRPILMASPYTSGLLANQVAFDLSSLGIELQDISSDDGLNDGVLYDSFQQDEEGNYTNYELYPQLRETGGKATFTGKAESASENKQYANSYGMEGLYIQYANLASIDSINYYKENRQSIIDGIVNGILNYYKIEEGTD